MTEQQLVEFGFEKVWADNSYKYYYYSYDMGIDYEYEIYSCENDEVEKGVWFVSYGEHNMYRFYDMNELKLFIDILRRNLTSISLRNRNLNKLLSIDK